MKCISSGTPPAFTAFVWTWLTDLVGSRSRSAVVMSRGAFPLCPFNHVSVLASEYRSGPSHSQLTAKWRSCAALRAVATASGAA